MKAVNFEYARPGDLSAAIALAERTDANIKLIAGGQSLGPMLNLRLVQPDLLVDITAIPELKRFEQKGDVLFIGSCITHTDIEDGRVPDVTGGAMRAIAEPSVAVWCTPIHPPIGFRRWRRSGRRP